MNKHALTSSSCLICWKDCKVEERVVQCVTYLLRLRCDHVGTRPARLPVLLDRSAVHCNKQTCLENDLLTPRHSWRSNVLHVSPGILLNTKNKTSKRILPPLPFIFTFVTRRRCRTQIQSRNDFNRIFESFVVVVHKGVFRGDVDGQGMWRFQASWGSHLFVGICWFDLILHELFGGFNL